MIPAAGRADTRGRYLGGPWLGRWLHSFDAAVAYQVSHIDVTDEAITAAQFGAWNELRIGLEAGGATALAALLSGAYEPQRHEVVGVLGCGGNVDIATLLNAVS